MESHDNGCTGRRPHPSESGSNRRTGQWTGCHRQRRHYPLARRLGRPPERGAAAAPGHRNRRQPASRRHHPHAVAAWRHSRSNGCPGRGGVADRRAHPGAGQDRSGDASVGAHRRLGSGAADRIGAADGTRRRGPRPGCVGAPVGRRGFGKSRSDIGACRGSRGSGPAIRNSRSRRQPKHRRFRPDCRADSTRGAETGNRRIDRVRCGLGFPGP